jgi:hypothetical protein
MRVRSTPPTPTRVLTLLLWAALCVLSIAHLEPAPPQLAVVATDVSGDVAVAADPDEDKGPVVRCRMCGAKIAHKQYVAALLPSLEVVKLIFWWLLSAASAWTCRTMPSL